jgi:hypothetical protein
VGGGDASACQTVVGCVRREVGGEGGRQRARGREGGGEREGEVVDEGGVGRRGACIGGEEGASK